jgi:hypothetical protein
MSLGLGDVLAVEGDGAAAGGQQAEHCFQQGGLPGSVVTHHREDGVVGHGEGDPVHHIGGAVPGVQVDDVEHHLTSSVSKLSTSASTSAAFPVLCARPR